MMIFEWFVFDPLNFEEFQKLFPVPSEKAKIWFNWWLEAYDHLSWRFYTAQYQRHKLIEFRKFSRAYSLGLNYPEDLGIVEDSMHYSDLWKEWKSSNNALQEHLEVVSPLLEYSRKQTEWISMSERIEKFAIDLNKDRDGILM